MGQQLRKLWIPLNKHWERHGISEGNKYFHLDEEEWGKIEVEVTRVGNEEDFKEFVEFELKLGKIVRIWT